ncbi:hypothetical protein EUX98_g9551, partial [Antrodiella citrinella]
MGEYWTKFPWYVPLDKEPGDEGVESEEPELTEEVEEEKGVIIAKTTESIKHWYRWRRTKHVSKTDNPWAPFLQQLRIKSHQNAPPHRLPIWQMYMKANAADVEQELQDRWPTAGLEPKRKINFRGAIAREFVNRLEEAERQEYERQARELHEREMKTYQAELSQSLDALTPQDIQ